MHRADHARIERPHDVLDGDRRGFARSDGCANERLLAGSGLPGAVARREVPRGWRHDLIVENAPLPDFEPMAERAARGFD